MLLRHFLEDTFHFRTKIYPKEIFLKNIWYWGGSFSTTNFVGLFYFELTSFRDVVKPHWYVLQKEPKILSVIFVGNSAQRKFLLVCTLLKELHQMRRPQGTPRYFMLVKLSFEWNVKTAFSAFATRLVDHSHGFFWFWSSLQVTQWPLARYMQNKLWWFTLVIRLVPLQ